MSTTRRGQSTPRTGRADLYQIGDVAERVDLSLRTVRYYEEAGLLMPAGRTAGGFRLYDEDTVERLFLIKMMKPLGFTLEEMRSLLTLRDELSRPGLALDARAALEERLRTWVVLAEEKLAALRQQVGVAEAFVSGLYDDADRSRRG
ncbi:MULTISPECIES: MerR family transcriptional regulator [unclassified Pseudofrankia]|uniref:MerR family transcriptional regulator n=1 Tax=unclassified Pseudofrankia TaxID=2994372 RepID=UPI0008D9A521|nr:MULTISPECIES: MerR family transcriptional regulator [unclassified Pseudofrankia]MDT3441326.1 MerR family transcriptional regulator [Pseudofrankia sp. BMG5.37]OHV47990.1 MerR family transcriptional regulator [Pseudofrankia sp. BMG5.36]